MIVGEGERIGEASSVGERSGEGDTIGATTTAGLSVGSSRPASAREAALGLAVSPAMPGIGCCGAGRGLCTRTHGAGGAGGAGRGGGGAADVGGGCVVGGVGVATETGNGPEGEVVRTPSHARTP